MAGAGKNRQRKERKNGNGKGSPENTSPSTHESSQSPPKQASPPSGLDGDRDPAGGSIAGAASARGAQAPVIASRAHRNVDMGISGSFLLLGVSPQCYSLKIVKISFARFAFLHHARPFCVTHP